MSPRPRAWPFVVAFASIWLGWKVGEALCREQPPVACLCGCRTDAQPQERAEGAGPSAVAQEPPRVRLGVVR